MPLHDRYGRITPYELLLPDERFADRFFPDVEREAGARRIDLGAPAGFLLLAAANAALSELVPEGLGLGAVHPHGLLLFHAFHHWRDGTPGFLLSVSAARFLVETETSGEGWTPVAPTPSGYLQLPQHLFWIEDPDGGRPESVDGIFWTLSADDRLTALAVVGIRPDPSGFGVVPTPTVPFRDAPSWIGARIRAGESDFRSRLPGAQLDRLYGLASVGEILKLLARVFRHIDGTPDALAPELTPPEGVVPEPREGGDGGPTPSALPCRIIGIGGRT